VTATRSPRAALIGPLWRAETVVQRSDLTAEFLAEDVRGRPFHIESSEGDRLYPIGQFPGGFYVDGSEAVCAVIDQLPPYMAAQWLNRVRPHWGDLTAWQMIFCHEFQGFTAQEAHPIQVASVE